MADQEADANKTRALTRTGTLNKKHRKRKINPTLPPTANSLHAVCSCP